jgi:hypothetical protein
MLDGDTFVQDINQNVETTLVSGILPFFPAFVNGFLLHVPSWANIPSLVSTTSPLSLPLNTTTRTISHDYIISSCTFSPALVELAPGLRYTCLHARPIPFSHTLLRQLTLHPHFETTPRKARLTLPPATSCLRSIVRKTLLELSRTLAESLADTISTHIHTSKYIASTTRLLTPPSIRPTDTFGATVKSSAANMAAPKNSVAADNSNKKQKGLKDFKKLEKEKAKAKRAAAAENNKITKVARVATVVVGNKEVAPAEEVSTKKDTVAKVDITPQESAIEKATASEVIDNQSQYKNAAAAVEPVVIKDETISEEIAVEEVTAKETNIPDDPPTDKAASGPGTAVAITGEVAPAVKTTFRKLIMEGTIIYDPWTEQCFSPDGTAMSSEEVAKLAPLPSAADVEMMRALVDSIQCPKAEEVPEVVVAAPGARPEGAAMASVFKLNLAAKVFVTKLNPAAKEFVPTSIPQIIVTQHSTESTTSAKAAEAIITTKLPLYKDHAGNEIVDIDAHRKTLLDDLLDACAKKTPRQMLNRCKQMSSVTTENYPKEYDEEDVVSSTEAEDECRAQEFAPVPKCLDDNDFEITLVKADPAVEDVQAKTESPVATELSVEQPEIKAKASPSLNINDLFAAVSKAGLSFIDASKSSTRPLESINAPHRLARIVVKLLQAADTKAKLPPTGKSISMDQLFSAATASGKTTTSRKTAGWSLESIEAEMRAVSNNNPAGFIDPAIVSAKVKQQAPGKAGILKITVTKPETELTANEHATASAKLKALIGVTCPTPELSPDSSHGTGKSSPVFNAEAQAYTPATAYSLSPPFMAQDGWTGVPQWGLGQPLHVFPDGGAFGKVVSVIPFNVNHKQFDAPYAAHRQEMKDTHYTNWAARGHAGGREYTPLQPREYEVKYSQY